MSDPIDRQAAIDAIKKSRFLVDAMEKVIKLPPTQPERKTGKWITYTKGSVVTAYKCSECGRTVRDDTGYDVAKDYPFCHCGADMRGEQDDKCRQV